MLLYSMEGLPKVESRKYGSHQKVNLALVTIEAMYSVSCQLIRRKINRIFLPVKLPYRRHSSLT